MRPHGTGAAVVFRFLRVSVFQGCTLNKQYTDVHSLLALIVECLNIAKLRWTLAMARWRSWQSSCGWPTCLNPCAMLAMVMCKDECMPH